MQLTPEQLATARESIVIADSILAKASTEIDKLTGHEKKTLQSAIDKTLDRRLAFMKLIEDHQAAIQNP